MENAALLLDFVHAAENSCTACLVALSSTLGVTIALSILGSKKAKFIFVKN